MRNRPIAGRYLELSISASKLSSLALVSFFTTPADRETHGLMGSARVSSKSSILLVCSRIASRGDGSDVAAECEGPPNGRWSGPR